MYGPSLIGFEADLTIDAALKCQTFITFNKSLTSTSVLSSLFTARATGGF